MRCLLFAVGVLLAPLVARAQQTPPLAPLPLDSLRTLAVRLHTVGWLSVSGSPAALVDTLAAQGLVRGRGDLLQLVRTDPTGDRVPFMTYEVTPGDSAIVPIAAAYADSLRALGVLPAAYAPVLVRESTRRGFWPPALIVQLAGALAADAERRHPARIGPFADSLVRVGLASPANAARLVRDAESGRLERADDVVRYLDPAIPFGRVLRGDSSASALAAITSRYLAAADSLRHRGLPMPVLAEARSVLESLPGDTARRLVRFEAQVAGRRYATSGEVWQNVNAQRLWTGQVSDAATLFGAVLRDAHADVRTLGVADPMFDTLRPQYVLVVTRPQRAFVERSAARGDGYVPLPYFAGGDFETPPVDSLEAALARYGRLGLFDGLTPAAFDSLRRNLPQHGGDKLSLLSTWDLGLPAVWYPFEDAEHGGDHPYADLVRDAAAISHGAFRPADVADDFEWERPRGAVTFRVGPRRFRIPFQHEGGDHYDSEAVHAVFRAANEVVMGGRFLYESERLVGFHFLTPPQRAALEVDGLRFEDP